MVQTTRYRILEILKEQDDVTVTDLAHQLDMAPVSVRHHLDVLQAESLICTPNVRRRGTVGRPRRVYALTEAADAFFPDNHQALVVTMLEELKHILAPAELATMFERVADRMAGEAQPISPEASMEERLQIAVEFLNEKGYLARWEKNDGDLVLYTLNCPYSGVSNHQGELCKMDKRLINTVAGISLTPVSRMSDGDCRCAYKVNSNAIELV